MISVRQSDHYGNIWASLPGAGYGQFEHKADSLIAKFKEAGGTVREIDVWAESPRLSPLYVLCIIVCLSWAVNHYRDNAITYKAQRDKNARELKLANAAITDMQMRQRDVAALDAKYEELADAKAENDTLRDDVAAGHRRLHIKAVCQSVREAATASGVDNAASRLADTAERDYFTLQREADHYAKNNWKERSILMSSADRVAHIDGQLVQCEQYTRASSGV